MRKFTLFSLLACLVFLVLPVAYTGNEPVANLANSELVERLEVAISDCRAIVTPEVSAQCLLEARNSAESLELEKRRELKAELWKTTLELLGDG